MTWHRVSVGSVIRALESGSRPKGGASSDRGDVPSLGGENIVVSGGVTVNDVKLVPAAFYAKMTKGHLEDGDVLINKDGAQTGKVGWYRAPAAQPACINEHLFLLRGIANRITQGYLYYTLLSEGGQQQIRMQISGSAQPGLNSDFVNRVVTAIPEAISEQSAVVEILSSLDRAIVQTEALIAKQQRIKVGLMQDMLTRGIDESGTLRSELTHAFKESPLGRIPVEWNVHRMVDLTAQIVDGVHHTPTYLPAGIPFVVVSDLTSGFGIDFANTRFVSEAAHKEYAKRADPRPGDVLVSKDGTLGVARVVPTGAPVFSIFVSVALLRAKPERCLPELLWAFFESGEFSRQLGSLSSGTGLAHIHLDHFRRFQLRCPDVDEQRRIFAVIAAHQRVLRSQYSSLEKLWRLRTGVMQDMLTGKRRVPPLHADSERTIG